MKQDETRVYLWFIDYGEEASIVTQLVGIEPTLIGVPGQPNAQFPQITHRVHKWEFYSPLDLSAHIDQHFAALLHLLEPHAEAIKTATQRWKGGLNAAVYYYQDVTPGIHLPARLIKVVASMNLSIDLDLYFLKDETDSSL